MHMASMLMILNIWKNTKCSKPPIRYTFMYYDIYVQTNGPTSHLSDFAWNCASDLLPTQDGQGGCKRINLPKERCTLLGYNNAVVCYNSYDSYDSMIVKLIIMHKDVSTITTSKLIIHDSLMRITLLLGRLCQSFWANYIKLPVSLLPSGNLT